MTAANRVKFPLLLPVILHFEHILSRSERHCGRSSRWSRERLFEEIKLQLQSAFKQDEKNVFFVVVFENESRICPFF